MLRKDYERKCSVENKIAVRESQGAWRQDELIGVNSQSQSNSDSDSEFVRVVGESVTRERLKTQQTEKLSVGFSDL
jgi:hypothetical protein